MQPFLDEQANEQAEAHRVAARFACIIMGMRQPARWAWRRWREACIDDESKWAVVERTVGMTHDDAWRNLAARTVMLSVRRAVGFMGELRCANALWRVVLTDAAPDRAQSEKDATRETGASAGMSNTSRERWTTQ